MRALPRHRQGSCGAVLAEVVMTTVVGALLLSVLPGFYFAYVNLWRQETARLGAGQRSSFVVRRMKADIRNARAVLVASDGSRLTLTMPRLVYDSDLRAMSVAIDSDGTQMSGDTITYYFEQDPSGTGSAGGNVYRQVTRVSGTREPPRLVADSIYPTLNPLSPSAGTSLPLFYHDGDKDTVVVTATAAEPRPSGSLLAAAGREPVCTRDGSALARMAAEGHPEGVIMCTECGDQVRPATELVAFSTEIRLRNH